MKLASKVNYILLPIIAGIFSLAGVFAYYGMKAQQVSALSEQLHYEVSSLNTDIIKHLYSMSELNRLILNSPETIDYLTSTASQQKTYSFESELLYQLNNKQRQYESLFSFGIYTLSAEPTFFINLEDPFIEYETRSEVSALVDETNKALTKSGSVQLKTERYLINNTVEGLTQLSSLKIFSPERLLSQQSFSQADALHIAHLVSNGDVVNHFRTRLDEKFNGQFKLIIQPVGMLTQLTKLNEMRDTQYDLNLVHHFKSDLVNISLELSHVYINKELEFVRNAVFSAVVGLVLVCFLILKWLIHVQVIFPVIQLASQVKRAKFQSSIELTSRTVNDEVTELNNSYVDLFKHVNNLLNNDFLTGVANRVRFNHLLAEAISQQTQNNTSTALLYIDLDNFKKVNDGFGHEVGDALLIQFSHQLQESLRLYYEEEGSVVNGQVARLAGDEFAILLTNISNPTTAEIVAQRVLALFEHGFKVSQYTHDVHASIGIALSPQDSNDAASLLHRADLAMYSAKESGKNCFRLFSRKLEIEIERRALIEHGLKSAIDNNRFKLVFMPMFKSDGKTLVGLEALLRTTEPRLNDIGPDEFIPVAESTGLIKTIDEWVIENAIECLDTLIQLFRFKGNISINMSSVELHNERFVERLSKILDSYNVPPEQIELEITETCLAPDDDKAVSTLTAIKELGVSLALDDFGTGYTAFSQLAKYPIDTLKIDRSFISQVDDTISGKHIKHKKLTVDIIVELASLYNLQVVAEGIEQANQLEHVRKIGCDLVQGFYLSKPIEWDELILLLTREPQNKVG